MAWLAAEPARFLLAVGVGPLIVAQRRLVFGHLPRTRQIGVPSLLAHAAHRRRIHCPERILLERVFPVVRVGSLFAHALDSGNTTTIISVTPLIFKMQAINLRLVSHPKPSYHSITTMHIICPAMHRQECNRIWIEITFGIW